MKVLIRALLCAAALCAPTAVISHAQEAGALSTDQVRAEFVNGGFQVGPPTTWWNDGSTSFVVRPSAASNGDERVLVVIVYRDMQSADDARQRAEAGAAALTTPGLLPGYAATFWWQNVALVESGMTQLSQRYQAEVESDMVHDNASSTNGQPSTAAAQTVDADFVSVLLQGAPTANL